MSDALRNIFGNSQQEAVVSYGATIDNALANVSHVMRIYGQNGPVSRRQRASQRARTPYMDHGNTSEKTQSGTGTFFTTQLQKEVKMSHGVTNHLEKSGKATLNILIISPSQKF